MTVITAFQVPVSQNLVQNPADLTNDILTNVTIIIYEIAILNGLKVPVELLPPAAFEPARSDEIVTLLWYSALLLSVRSHLQIQYRIEFEQSFSSATDRHHLRLWSTMDRKSYKNS